MAGLSKDMLSGYWVHSFEEDSNEAFVFRPKDYDFPRSRGRRALDLQASGKMMDLSPGRADVPEPISGDWEIEDDAVVIRYDDGNGERLCIEEVVPGKLVIRKTS